MYVFSDHSSPDWKHRRCVMFIVRPIRRVQAPQESRDGGIVLNMGKRCGPYRTNGFVPRFSINMTHLRCFQSGELWSLNTYTVDDLRYILVRRAWYRMVLTKLVQAQLCCVRRCFISQRRADATTFESAM